MFERPKLTYQMVQELESDLQAKREELKRIRKSRGECRPILKSEEADNAELLSIEAIEKSLEDTIDRLQRTLDTCQIIELDSSDKSIVSIGAIVTVEVSAIEKDEEPFEMKLTLSDDNRTLGTDGILRFTINSPIGKCIIGKGIGYIGEYIVDSVMYGKTKYACKVLSVEY